MKKLIFSIVFIGLVAVPFAVKADMVSDLQAQINTLLQQIQSLQSQLNTLQGQTQPPITTPPIPPLPTIPTSCLNFTYNLYLGSTDSQTNGEVSALQKFLAQDSSIYPEGLITGYFGPATEKAVQRWQAKNNIVSSGSPDTTGYGVVGSKTRAAIRKSCGTTSISPSITVLSPNGGESWTIELGPYTIAWQQSQNTQVDIWLQNKKLSPRPDTDAAYYIKTILGEFKGQIGKNVYGWTVSSDTLPASGYEICVGGYFNVGFERPALNENCSDAPFSIVSTTTNQPPVIDSVSGPSTLNVGQVGTWTIKAYDPENSQMSYFVIWGDEEDSSLLRALDNLRSVSTPFTQTATLTHSYSKASIYNPSFTITDSAGQSAKTSISVNVGAVPTPASALKVESGTQPFTSLFPLKAARMPFTVIKLTAPADQDVKVNSLTVERIGLSSDALFSGIVLLDENGIQIGAEKNLNSSHQATLSEPFTVAKGATKTMTIAGNRADVSGYAGQVVYLSLVGVNSGAIPINGSLPITGAGHTANDSLSIGSMVVSRGATDPGINQTKVVGTAGYTFSSVTVTAGSIERVRLQSIRWYQSGSMPQSYFANVKTYVDGVAYSTYVSNDGHYYTSNFDNGIVIEKAYSKEISLKADIIDGKGETADFDILNRADLYVKGEVYGYGIMPPNGTDTFGSDDGSFHQSTLPWYDAFQVNVGGVAVLAPALTASVSSLLPSQNVGAGQVNFTFAYFILDATNSGENVSVRSIPLAYAAVGGDIENLTNCKLYDGTTLLTSGANVVNPSYGTGVVFNLDNPLIVAKATSKQITLKCDVSGSAPQNSIYKWGLKTFTATGFSSGTGFVVNITGDTWGPTMTVKTGAYSVSLDVQSPAYRIVAAGSTNVELARIKFSALVSGEDIELKQVALQLSDTNLNTPIDLVGRKVTLWDGSTQIGEATFPTGDNAISSAISNFVIPRGSSKSMIIKGNIADISPAGPLTQSGDLLKVDYDGNNNGRFGNYGVGRISGATISPSSPDTQSAGVLITTTSIPSITVLSPNGGESWTVGETKRISWTAGNVNYVRIYIEDPTIIFGSGSTQYVYDGVLPASQGYYDWTIIQNRLPGLTFPRNYKIRIDGVNNTALGSEVITRDSSDALFSIAAATTAVLSANSQKLDYNNDGKLDQTDANLLSSIWTSGAACPGGYVCDVIRSGVFTIADIQTLTNITLGTGSVPDYKTSLLEANPQKIDYNNDGKLDTADYNILTNVFLGSQACPAGKICDVNQDGQSATIGDVVKMTNIINGSVPVPDYSATPLGNAPSLNQMAGVLEGMKGILEQLGGLLK